MFSFYLSLTFIAFNDDIVIKKNCVCIGSSVAPFLCDLFLAECNKRIDSQIDKSRVVRIFRCVDYLVIFKSGTPDEAQTLLNRVLEVFQALCTSARIYTRDTCRRSPAVNLFLGEHVRWMCNLAQKRGF